MGDALRIACGAPVVIDTSVAFKWFDTAEPGALHAAELLDAHAADDIALVAPHHLPIELLNAHVSRGATLPELLEAVEALAEADLLIAPVDAVLLADAARIAHGEGLTLYDAVFAALAAALDAELVTADRRLAATRACRTRLVE